MIAILLLLLLLHVFHQQMMINCLTFYCFFFVINFEPIECVDINNVHIIIMNQVPSMVIVHLKKEKNSIIFKMD